MALYFINIIFSASLFKNKFLLNVFEVHVHIQYNKVHLCFIRRVMTWDV